MNKSYVMGLLVLALVLLGATTFSGRFLYNRNADLDVSGKWVSHTYEVISGIERLNALTEAMVANQRGHLLTRHESFLERYNDSKTQFLETWVRVSEWTKDNPLQTQRLSALREKFEEFFTLLEKNTEQYQKQSLTSSNAFSGASLEIVDRKMGILQLAGEAIDAERQFLEERLIDLQDKKQQYFVLLLASAAGIVSLLFFFNAGLLYTQTRRLTAEQSLRESEERYMLALAGANDGIFDWNLKNNKVFYSAQFFKMLGLQRGDSTGTIQDFKDLIHPEDDIKVWQYLERYLHGEMAEYSNTFRMRHANGHWVWIQSRAKAVFDRSGKPQRVVGAHSDITFVKEYQDNLRHEKHLAEQASQAKSDFLAHMSHEIRTPLTAISGIAEIFQRNQSNLDEKQRQLLRTLYLSTSSLKDLVNDILDFSKIESGELELKIEDFYLIELFEQVASIMSVNAGEKGLAFSLDYNAVRNLAFSGDRQRLRQILINLIGNAIKFTEKGSVVVTVLPESIGNQNYLKIRIADTGIGIAAENHEMIFERFKQADASVSRRHQGTGLGLPISARLVQLMGGTISVESELGKGSTFTVLLPMHQTGRLPEDAEGKTFNKKLSDRIKANISGEYRLLVVEDYEGNIVVLGYILDEMGYVYDIARNGAEALRMWKERHYDIVLMDIQMPEMDGFTATESIRALEREKSLEPTTIIGMTAHALVGDKDKCIDAGMDAYIAKPIAEHELKTLIIDHLKRKNKAA